MNKFPKRVITRNLADDMSSLCDRFNTELKKLIALREDNKLDYDLNELVDIATGYSKCATTLLQNL